MHINDGAFQKYAWSVCTPPPRSAGIRHCFSASAPFNTCMLSCSLKDVSDYYQKNRRGLKYNEETDDNNKINTSALGNCIPLIAGHRFESAKISGRLC